VLRHGRELVHLLDWNLRPYALEDLELALVDDLGLEMPTTERHPLVEVQASIFAHQAALRVNGPLARRKVDSAANAVRVRDGGGARPFIDAYLLNHPVGRGQVYFGTE